MREQIPRTIHQERSCAHRRLKHSNDYCRPLHDPWSTRHFWRRQEVSATFTFRRPGGFFHPSRNIPKFYHLAAVRGEWRTSVQFFVCCFLTCSSTTVQWLAWARAAGASANFRQKQFFAVALQSLENVSRIFAQKESKHILCLILRCLPSGPSRRFGVVADRRRPRLLNLPGAAMPTFGALRGTALPRK